MDFSEYMWNVALFKPTELGRFEVSLLQAMISSGIPVSTYEVWKYWGFHNIAYKNVHKRLARLRQLKIIKGTEEKSPRGTGAPDRGAKYYKVSLFGFIQAMDSFYLNFPKDLIKNYKNNLLLKTLLYQFFDENTIACATSRLESEIHDYLRRCCSITFDACKDACRINYFTRNLETNKKNGKMTQRDFDRRPGDIFMQRIQGCRRMIRFMEETKVMKTNFGISHANLIKRFKQYLDEIRKRIKDIENNHDLDECTDLLTRLESMTDFKMAHFRADLEWNVKAMAIRLATGNDFMKALIDRDLIYDDTYGKTNELLRNDKKFSNLLQVIKSELDHGFNLLI